MTVYGEIEASVLSLTVDVSGDAGVPDGAICINKSNITLPELPLGSVRTIKILNPQTTRTNPEDLVLIPQNGKVKINVTSLSWLDAISARKTVYGKGVNGNSYMELLGYNNNGKETIWLLHDLKNDNN